jgi:hypothetical protein
LSDTKEIRDKIDNYEQTILGILGFINFFLYDPDLKKKRDDVVVFQGRRFVPSPGKSFNQNEEKVDYVTPDIGILLPSGNGILGEVKKSFPQDQEKWFKIFKQIQSYDDDLTGWPSGNEKVNSHDVVLLLHQSRGAAVRKFFESNKGKGIDIKRPFAIVEFNRSDERRPYLFFRNALGGISEKSVDIRLKDGVPVPMDVFVKIYSTIKIYDDEPPLPYLMQLIWEHVVLSKAKKSGRLEKLRKNQKIDVEMEIEFIIEELYRGFSFRMLYDKESDRQPKIPKREWILRACKKFVEMEEAKWVEQGRTAITFFFRQYDDVLTHFIESCGDEDTVYTERSLFKESES